MPRELGATTTVAAIALTAFWAMVTVGRIGVAKVERWISVRTTYHILPVLLAGTFVLIAALPRGATGAGVLAFGLAGLGCSALLPLTISGTAVLDRAAPAAFGPARWRITHLG